jgi:hypothetical protein
VCYMSMQHYYQRNDIPFTPAGESFAPIELKLLSFGSCNDLKNIMFYTYIFFYLALLKSY